MAIDYLNMIPSLKIGFHTCSKVTYALQKLDTQFWVKNHILLKETISFLSLLNIVFEHQKEMYPPKKWKCFPKWQYFLIISDIMSRAVQIFLLCVIYVWKDISENSSNIDYRKKTNTLLHDLIFCLFYEVNEKTKHQTLEPL